MSDTSQKLDKQYEEVMKNHPYGIALYRPLRTSLFKPGAFGYFDELGEWNLIGHLDDADLLARKGLIPVENDLEKAPVENGIKWGPMTSLNMKGTRVQVAAGIDPVPGIPLSVSAVYSYTVEKGTGALLLTSPSITHEHYYHTSPFKKWCKDNASSIIQNATWGADVKSNGFWIITSTYSAKRCAINMWNNKGRGFKVGFGDAEGHGQTNASIDWYYSHMDEGWSEYTQEGESDKSVVFYGGVKFQYSRRLGKEMLKPTRRPDHRGPRIIDGSESEGEFIVEVPDTEEENASYLVEGKTYLSEEDEDLLDIWHS